MIDEDMLDPGKMLNDLILEISNKEEEILIQDISYNDEERNNPSTCEKFVLENENTQKKITELIEKNLQSQKTLAKYETNMKKLIEDSITTIGEIENLRNRNNCLEKKNSELQSEVSTLQSLNDEYLRYKKLHEDDVAPIHKLEQNIKEMEASLALKKETGSQSSQKGSVILESYLTKAMKYMSKFGVKLNKRGYLSSKTKSELLKDFKGIENMVGTVGVQISKEIKKIVKNYPVKTCKSTSSSDISSHTSYQRKDETGNDLPNKVISPKTDLIFGDGFEYPSESPSVLSSTSSQFLSDIDFLSDDEAMQIDEEMPNIESAGKGFSEGCTSPYGTLHNPDVQPKVVENVILQEKCVGEEALQLNITESPFLASIQSQSLSDTNSFGRVEKVVETPDTEPTRVCDEPISQYDVTTYNSEDQLKIHAESHVDLMLLKHSRVDVSDTRGFESNKLCSTATEKSSFLECEIAQVDSSENGIQNSPLLPSHFHDSSRPNTFLRENFVAIQKAHLKQTIIQAAEKENVTQKSKYALRSTPPEELSYLPDETRGKGDTVSSSLPFESAMTAVMHYDSVLINVKYYLKYRQARKYRRVREDNPVTNVLNKLEHSLLEDSFIKLAVPSVIKTLTNRDVIPEKSDFLYYVFNYIYSLGCSFEDTAPVEYSLHPHEKVLLSALFEVDKMKKMYLNNLMDRALESLHFLFIRKPVLLPTGVFALCRVFTEICRQQNLVQKPVSLAVDLLKRRHKHVTLIITSIISVWSEPFEVTEATPDEEKCLHSAISFGVFKWHFMKHQMHPKPQYQIKYEENIKDAYKILEKHICPVPDNEVLLEVIEFLFAKIHLECDCRSPLDVENILFAPIIIFAAFSDWIWVQKHILDKHVVPSLSKYEQEQNETAFGVFCDLYAEIFSFSSGTPSDTVLLKYYRRETISEGNGFLKDYAALSLLRFLVLNKANIKNRYNLLDWLRENTQNSRTKPFVRFMEKGFVKSSITSMRLIKDDF